MDAVSYATKRQKKFCYVRVVAEAVWDGFAIRVPVITVQRNIITQPSHKKYVAAPEYFEIKSWFSQVLLLNIQYIHVINIERHVRFEFCVIYIKQYDQRN